MLLKNRPAKWSLPKSSTLRHCGRWLRSCASRDSNLHGLSGGTIWLRTYCRQTGAGRSPSVLLSRRLVTPQHSLNSFGRASWSGLFSTCVKNAQIVKVLSSGRKLAIPRLRVIRLTQGRVLTKHRFRTSRSSVDNHPTGADFGLVFPAPSIAAGVGVDPWFDSY